MPPESTATLTENDVMATADAIARHQLPSGLILWFGGGHADLWNHVEAAMALDVAGAHDAARRAYAWAAEHQHRGGWWHHYYLADGVEDAKVDTNCCAYVAAGVWHHYRVTGDRAFLAEMWPVVEAAVEYVLDLQRPGGEIAWARHTDGTPWSYALLTGSSSIYHSLQCAVAVAETLLHERPDWELGAVRLRDAIVEQPDLFEPKHRWAMDWYYPVLSGAVSGEAALDRLAAGWPTFVMEGLGVRCVSDRPWVTAAETCECALAHLRLGLEDAARRLVSWLPPHRRAGGGYRTGIVYPEAVSFPPEECSTYTAAAVLLAADALDRRTAAWDLFLTPPQC